MQQMIFIADFIAFSTCFGQYHAHHQELESITQMVAACGIWCCKDGKSNSQVRQKLRFVIKCRALYMLLQGMSGVVGAVCECLGQYLRVGVHSPHNTRHTLQQHIQRSTLNDKTQLLLNLRITFPVFAAPNTTGSDHLYNTLQLLMMGMALPETC